MRGELGKLPGLAVPACAGFGGVRQGGRGSQILADGDQLRQTRVGRVGGAPGSVKKPRDSDEVSDGLGWERTRHASKEQPLRRGVKPALTLLVRTRPHARRTALRSSPGRRGPGAMMSPTLPILPTGEGSRRAAACRSHGRSCTLSAFSTAPPTPLHRLVSWPLPQSRPPSGGSPGHAR